MERTTQNNIQFTLLLILFSLLSSFSYGQYVCGDMGKDRSGYFDSLGIQRNIRIYDAYGTEFLPSEIAYGDSVEPQAMILPVVTPPCNAGLFTVHFSHDPNNVTNYGFFDAVLGQARRDVVCQVFRDLSVLLNVNPLNQGRVHIWVGSDEAYAASLNTQFPSGGVGALSSQFFVTPLGLNNVIIDGEVYKSIRSGQDSYNGLPGGLIPSGSDGLFHSYIAVNFATSNWYLDYTGTSIGATQNDLYSTILHEAIHNLGFVSNIAALGQSKYTSMPNVYYRFDKFLSRNTAANRLIGYVGTHDWQYLLGSPALPQNCNTSNNIIFSGNNLTNQTVYNSANWSNGSNLSHFGCSGTSICDAGYDAPISDYVMNPCSNQGNASIKRKPNSEEVEALCDLGYELRVSGGIIAYGEDPSNTTIYQIYSACSNQCVAIGNYDFYTTAFNTPITGTFTNILNNDENGGNIDEIFLITPNVGTLTTSGTGLTYTPANNFSGIAVIGYYPRCSGSNENGSLTYIFINVLAPPLPSCNLTGICGENLTPLGDFEAFVNENQLQNVLSYVTVPGSSTGSFGFATPVFDNTPNLRFNGNSNAFSCGGNYFIALPTGSTRAISMVIRMNNNINFPEGPAFQLCSPIPPNSTATIRFQASIPNSCLAISPSILLDFLGQPPVSNQNIYTSPGTVLPTINIPITNTNITNPIFGNYQVVVNNTSSVPITHMVISTSVTVNNFPSPPGVGMGSIIVDNVEVVLNPTTTPIQIAATPTNPTVCAGSTQTTISYQICLPQGAVGTNPSPITLQLNLPQGITVGTGSSFNAQGQITLPANSISSSNCVTLTLNAQLNNNVVVLGVPYSINLTATGGGCVLSTSSNTVTLNITPNPLSITTSVSNNNPAVGDVITYTIEVCNTGLTALNNVVITDVLPAGLTIQNLNGFIQNGNTLTQTINLAAAGSIGNPYCETFSFSAVVTGCSFAGATIDNCANARLGGPLCAAQSCVTIQLATLSVLISPFVLPTAICNGGSVTLNPFVLNGGSPANYTYLWSPTASLSCSNCSNPVASPTSTTTYTVTVTNTNTGCTATGSKTLPVTTVNASIAMTSNGCGTPVRLTASGGNCYAWSVPLGMSSPGNTPTINNAAPGNYTVTVSNCGLFLPNCSATATITVPSGSLAIGSGSSFLQSDLSWYFGQGLIQASGTTQSIYVEGNLNIDMDFAFGAGSLITAGAGAEIRINNGKTLTLNNTNVQGCDKLWKGFVVAGEGWFGSSPAGAIVVTNNTTIKDAYHAITINPGSKICVQDAHFTNNFIGILGNDGGNIVNLVTQLSMLSNQTCPLTNTTFSSTGSYLKPPYSPISATNGLPVPTVGINGFAGIYLDNLKTSFIVSGNTTFSNLGNGIVSKNNNLGVRGCTFTNIYPSGYTHSIIGTGVYATGISQNFPTPFGGVFLPQSPAYSLTVQQCGFTSMYQGVYANRINSTIGANRIQTAFAGINTLSNARGYTDIQANTISDVMGGIYLQGHDPYYQQYVCRNTVSAIGFWGTGDGINDMEAGNAPQTTSNVNGIVHNSITINGVAQNGIYVSGANKPIVRGHSSGHYISILNPNSAKTGITLKGCVDAQVSENNISGVNTTTVNNSYYPAAIQIAGTGTGNVSSGTICLNTTNNTYSGLLFNGVNAQHLDFNSNLFNNHNTGLWVAPNAVIAPQRQVGTQSYPNKNQWTSPYSSYTFAARHWSSNQFVIGLQRIYSSDPQGSVYFPPSNKLFPSSNWFSPTSNNAPTCCDIGVICKTDGTEDEEGGKLTPLQSSIIAKTLQFDDFNDELQWQAEEQLYAVLQQDEALRNSSMDAQQFYEEKDHGSIGQLARIRSLAEVFEQRNPMVRVMGGLVNEKQQLMEKWITADSLWAEAQTTEELLFRYNQTKAIRERIALNTLEIQGLSLPLYWAQKAQAKVLLAENQKIVPEGTVPQNEQLYNDIWLRTKFFNQTDYSPKQSATLEYLANQCPLQGGRAVYKARSLYATVHDSIISYDDDSLCAEAQKRLIAAQNDVIVSIYPNPANDVVYVGIKGNVTQTVRLEWYDALGRLVQSNELPASEYAKTTHTVHTNGLVNGIYQLLLSENGNKLYSGKLLITK